MLQLYINQLVNTQLIFFICLKFTDRAFSVRLLELFVLFSSCMRDRQITQWILTARGRVQIRLSCLISKQNTTLTSTTSNLLYKKNFILNQNRLVPKLMHSFYCIVTLKISLNPFSYLISQIMLWLAKVTI